MPTSWDYADAFRRNCPHARLNEDEREELARLFRVCADEARDKAQVSLTEQLHQQTEKKS